MDMTRRRTHCAAPNRNAAQHGAAFAFHGRRQVRRAGSYKANALSVRSRTPPPSLGRAIECGRA